MTRAIFSAVFLSVSCLFTPRLAFTKGFGTSAGLNLQQSSARAAALGEAFTAADLDVSAMNYNPAVLGTMINHRVLFSYEEGLFDDSMTQIILGSPFFRFGGMGFKMEYYNGGKITLDDNTSVNAQQDFVLSVGGGMKIKRISLGATGKYLSSTLAETASARALALDFGIDAQIHSRVRWGASIQNIGTPLRYVERDEPLPRIGRTGFAFSLPRRPTSQTTLFLDAAYFFNERVIHPSFGVETLVGPLAIRGGYRKEQGEDLFSVGTGIAWGPSMIDYSFGLSGQENNNKVSFSLMFGGLSSPDRPR